MKIASRHTNLFETHPASIVSANGRGRVPTPPALIFKACKLASKHMNLFQSHHASTALCLQMRGAAPHQTLMLTKAVSSNPI